jgi:hypothetical protein
LAWGRKEEKQNAAKAASTKLEPLTALPDWIPPIRRFQDGARQALSLRTLAKTPSITIAAKASGDHCGVENSRSWAASQP